MSTHHITPPHGRRRWTRRLVVTTALTCIAVVAAGGAAAASTALAAGVNPFDDVIPDFSIFGADFNSAWKKLLGGFWAMAFVGAAFGALRALLELQRAKKGGYANTIADNTESLKNSGWTVLGLTGVGVLFGAVIALF